MPRTAGYVCPRRTRKTARHCGRVRIDKGRRSAGKGAGTVCPQLQEHRAVYNSFPRLGWTIKPPDDGASCLGRMTARAGPHRSGGAVSSNSDGVKDSLRWVVSQFEFMALALPVKAGCRLPEVDRHRFALWPRHERGYKLALSRSAPLSFPRLPH